MKGGRRMSYQGRHQKQKPKADFEKLFKIVQLVASVLTIIKILIDFTKG